MIKLSLNRLNKRFFYYFLCLLFFTASFSSCKSHKKNRGDDTVYVGETIEIKKDSEKNKKTESTREKIVSEARTWMGTPYAYARQDKGVATDCSGMVFVIYDKIAGIKMPRNSAKQSEFCDNLKEKEVEAGDLVFFATGNDGKTVSHVGIMIDGVRFIHASGSKGVIMSDMTTPYYRRNLVKFGRVPGLR